jgi:hypothetical protein
VSRAFVAGLGIVAAMVAGAGCSADGAQPSDTGAQPASTGRPPASDEPRDDDITATLDLLWNAVGVDPDQVSIEEYQYVFEPDKAGCAELPVDDRWFGNRGSSVAPGLVDQGDLEAAITDALEAEGFTVQHFRSTHPQDPTRAIDAVNDDVRVFGHLSDDGFADITVRAGPCAPTFGSISEDLYEPDV